MRYIASLILGALAAGCNAAAEDATPTGVTETRDFPATGFDRVELRGSDGVTVTTGAAFAVSATGDRAVLDRLDIRVEDGVLVVGRKRREGMGWDRLPSAAVAVSLPALRGASLKGSGDMRVNAAEAPQFGAAVAGSGDLRIDALKAAEASFSIAGSGDLSVAGNARTASISIAGSGDMDAARLASETADISIAGSGNVRAGVAQTAKVSIVGSGDVEIIGGAACSVSKVGSGEVRCAPNAG